MFTFKKLLIGICVFQLVLPPGNVLAELTAVHSPLAQSAPLQIQGLRIDLDQDLRLQLLFSSNHLSRTVASSDIDQQIKFFLTALAVPASDLWVNLSPLEKDRMIAPAFGQTEMGREMLQQDVVLKQMTATLMSPDEKTGEKFWESIYDELHQKGITDLPEEVFHKVWIVPERAVVKSDERGVFIEQASLDVMLADDYKAFSEHYGKTAREVSGSQEFSADVTRLIKKVVLPVLKEEVNTGESFRPLRDMYHALILATWFRWNLRGHLLTENLADKNHVEGLGDVRSQDREKIYQSYLEFFNKGVFNVIQEQYDPARQSVVPKSFFTGGTHLFFQEGANNWVQEPLTNLPGDSYVAADLFIHPTPSDAAMLGDVSTELNSKQWDWMDEGLNEAFKDKLQQQEPELFQYVQAYPALQNLFWDVLPNPFDDARMRRFRAEYLNNSYSVLLVGRPSAEQIQTSSILDDRYHTLEDLRVANIQDFSQSYEDLRRYFKRETNRLPLIPVLQRSGVLSPFVTVFMPKGDAWVAISQVYPQTLGDVQELREDLSSTKSVPSVIGYEEIRSGEETADFLYQQIQSPADLRNILGSEKDVRQFESLAGADGDLQRAASVFVKRRADFLIRAFHQGYVEKDPEFIRWSSPVGSLSLLDFERVDPQDPQAMEYVLDSVFRTLRYLSFNFNFGPGEEVDVEALSRDFFQELFLNLSDAEVLLLNDVMAARDWKMERMLFVRFFDSEDFDDFSDMEKGFEEEMFDAFGVPTNAFFNAEAEDGVPELSGIYADSEFLFEEEEAQGAVEQFKASLAEEIEFRQKNALNLDAFPFKDEMVGDGVLSPVKTVGGWEERLMTYGAKKWFSSYAAYEAATNKIFDVRQKVKDYCRQLRYQTSPSYRNIQYIAARQRVRSHVLNQGYLGLRGLRQLDDLYRQHFGDAQKADLSEALGGIYDALAARMDFVVKELGDYGVYFHQIPSDQQNDFVGKTVPSEQIQPTWVFEWDSERVHQAKEGLKAGQSVELSFPSADHLMEKVDQQWKVLGNSDLNLLMTDSPEIQRMVGDYVSLRMDLLNLAKMWSGKGRVGERTQVKWNDLVSPGDILNDTKMDPIFGISDFEQTLKDLIQAMRLGVDADAHVFMEEGKSKNELVLAVRGYVSSTTKITFEEILARLPAGNFDVARIKALMSYFEIWPELEYEPSNGIVIQTNQAGVSGSWVLRLKMKRWVHLLTAGFHVIQTVKTEPSVFIDVDDYPWSVEEFQSPFAQEDVENSFEQEDGQGMEEDRPDHEQEVADLFAQEEEAKYLQELIDEEHEQKWREIADKNWSIEAEQLNRSLEEFESFKWHDPDEEHAPSEDELDLEEDIEIETSGLAVDQMVADVNDGLDSEIHLGDYISEREFEAPEDLSPFIEDQMDPELAWKVEQLGIEIEELLGQERRAVMAKNLPILKEQANIPVPYPVGTDDAFVPFLPMDMVAFRTPSLTDMYEKVYPHHELAMAKAVRKVIDQFFPETDQPFVTISAGDVPVEGFPNESLHLNYRYLDDPREGMLPVNPEVLPFQSSSLEHVVVWDALKFLKDIRGSVRELNRVTEQGGKVVIVYDLPQIIRFASMHVFDDELYVPVGIDTTYFQQSLYSFRKVEKNILSERLKALEDYLTRKSKSSVSLEDFKGIFEAWGEEKTALNPAVKDHFRRNKREILTTADLKFLRNYLDHPDISMQNLDVNLFRAAEMERYKKILNLLGFLPEKQNTFMTLTLFEHVVIRLFQKEGFEFLGSHPDQFDVSWAVDDFPPDDKAKTKAGDFFYVQNQRLLTSADGVTFDEKTLVAPDPQNVRVLASFGYGIFRKVADMRHPVPEFNPEKHVFSAAETVVLDVQSLQKPGVPSQVVTKNPAVFPSVVEGMDQIRPETRHVTVLVARDMLDDLDTFIAELYAKIPAEAEMDLVIPTDNIWSAWLQEFKVFPLVDPKSNEKLLFVLPYHEISEKLRLAGLAIPPSKDKRIPDRIKMSDLAKKMGVNWKDADIPAADKRAMESWDLPRSWIREFIQDFMQPNLFYKRLQELSGQDQKIFLNTYRYLLYALGYKPSHGSVDSVDQALESTLNIFRQRFQVHLGKRVVYSKEGQEKPFDYLTAGRRVIASHSKVLSQGGDYTVISLKKKDAKLTELELLVLGVDGSLKDEQMIREGLVLKTPEQIVSLRKTLDSGEDVLDVKAADVLKRLLDEEIYRRNEKRFPLRTETVYKPIDVNPKQQAYFEEYWAYRDGIRRMALKYYLDWRFPGEEVVYYLTDDETFMSSFVHEVYGDRLRPLMSIDLDKEPKNILFYNIFPDMSFNEMTERFRQNKARIMHLWDNDIGKYAPSTYGDEFWLLPTKAPVNGTTVFEDGFHVMPKKLFQDGVQPFINALEKFLNDAFVSRKAAVEAAGNPLGKRLSEKQKVLQDFKKQAMQKEQSLQGQLAVAKLIHRLMTQGDKDLLKLYNQWRQEKSTKLKDFEEMLKTFEIFQPVSSMGFSVNLLMHRYHALDVKDIGFSNDMVIYGDVSRDAVPRIHADSLNTPGRPKNVIFLSSMVFFCPDKSDFAVAFKSSPIATGHMRLLLPSIIMNVSFDPADKLKSPSNTTADAAMNAKTPEPTGGIDFASIESVMGKAGLASEKKTGSEREGWKGVSVTVLSIRTGILAKDFFDPQAPVSRPPVRDVMGAMPVLSGRFDI